MKHYNYILFNQEKIPLFSKQAISQPLIEKSIVMGMNGVEDEEVIQRMR
ncbi:hypothetical protein [Bacillus sp. M6-12]|nr:hypothetical protein [Bacillus sp. M6-12]